jgi:hypothetical protein
MKQDSRPMRRPLAKPQPSGRPQLRPAPTQQRRREFWAPTSESINEQMNKSSSRYDSPFEGMYLKAKNGDNTVRILPPTWNKPRHYCLEVLEHRRIGADHSNYLCLDQEANPDRQSCPICTAWRETSARGDVDGAKLLSPKSRYLCLVLHRNGDSPTKPLIWDLWNKINLEILGRTRDKKSDSAIDVTNPYEGYDLSFRKSGQMINTTYDLFEFDRDPSPLHDDPKVTEDIIDELYAKPLDSRLKFYDADHLEKVLFGTAEARDEELEVETEDTSQDYDHEQEEAKGAAYSTDEYEEQEEPPPEEDDGNVPFEEQEEDEEEEQQAEEEEEPEPEVAPRRTLSKKPPPKPQRRQQRRR